MAEETNDEVQAEASGALEQKIEEDERSELEESRRMLSAIRTIRELGLSAHNHGDSGRWSVARDGVVGFGESPAEALFYYQRACEGKPHRPYPSDSFSIRDLSYVDRLRWLDRIRQGHIDELQRQVDELKSLGADGAVRVLEGDGVELDGLADEQPVLMTAAALRQTLWCYRSPEAQRAEHDRLEAMLPGPRQVTGPDEAIGLPRYYRLDRRVYETAGGEAMQEWSPSAVDPGDDETMGFCGYHDAESAAAECRRHAEHVRGDATGVQLTPQWSASTIESFWYRWCEDKDGDSTKLTIADFVRDLCAAVKT